MNKGNCAYCGTYGPLEWDLIEYTKDNDWWYTIYFCCPECEANFIKHGYRNALQVKYRRAI